VGPREGTVAAARERGGIGCETSGPNLASMMDKLLTVDINNVKRTRRPASLIRLFLFTATQVFGFTWLSVVLFIYTYISSLILSFLLAFWLSCAHRFPLLLFPQKKKKKGDRAPPRHTA
jgi:hypothetical protein